MPTTDAIFEQERPRLARLAYRMLGSRADADDVLQEAYLRWSHADRLQVKSPESYLSTIVVRLSIDQRRQIDARKATYVGPWLPEPIIEADTGSVSSRAETAENLTLAFLVVLERLSPVERAAFLLRKVFDFDYDEIGEILEKSTANCRQIVHRAEEAVQAQRPRFAGDEEEAERMTTAFLNACNSGDLHEMVQLLADDVVVYSDGGGKAAAALAPIRGATRAARFFLGITKKTPAAAQVRRVLVNGQPGLMVLLEGRPVTVMTLEVVEGRIRNCYAIRNPEKLARIVLPG